MSTNKMDNKVALVTGSAKGIGRAYAEILLEHGVQVCISDINSEVGEATVMELKKKYGYDKVIFQKCDVTSENDLEDLFRKTVTVFGGLDIVVNNAGILNEAKWKLMLDTLLNAVIRGTNLGIQYMAKDKGGNGGVIINTSSIAGIMTFDVAPHYCTAKHAVVGFTRAIGDIAFRLHGVRVNAICPTFVTTDLIDFKPEDLMQGQLYEPSDNMFERLTKVSIGFGGNMKCEEVAKYFIGLIKDETITGKAMIISPFGSGVASGMPETLQETLKAFVPTFI